MKSVLMVGLLVLLASVACAQTPDLIISEYVEGSGDNKAIEIYNRTADVINLGGYALERTYADGARFVRGLRVSTTLLRPHAIRKIGWLRFLELNGGLPRVDAHIP